MSLVVFKNYLMFVDRVLAAKADLPTAIDAIELESVLVSHGVVLLFSHVERCYRAAIETKCNRCADLEVRTFALSVKDEKTGKIGMDSVKGTLKKFGKACREGFKADLSASNIENAWDSVVNQRVKVAHHGERASIPLGDLRNYYEDVRKVLGYFCKALGLDAAEVATISSLIVLPAQQAATGEPAPAA
ncbi:hypothetical protein LCGC14_1536320 [marine sediment metagenome]|uniref:RiboL-PSP-HEPN domain-containing protein n=1 Tax=marine sediment metagenome TaxID=412755 RepID=A0A0F9LV85_9ZZZZ